MIARVEDNDEGRLTEPDGNKPDIAKSRPVLLLRKDVVEQRHHPVSSARTSPMRPGLEGDSQCSVVSTVASVQDIQSSPVRIYPSVLLLQVEC